MPTPRKMKPHTRAWWNAANALARSYAPRIYPCAHCGGPVADGYCCQRCGTDDPQGHTLTGPATGAR